MSAKGKRNIYFFLGKVILIALLIVFIIRCFFVESYVVTSSQMESSLSEGDRVLVNKTSYGIRLPIAILTIPFTFDTFFGYKSYSSSVQLPYKRIFSDQVERNDVVLFNNPNEAEKPLDKRSLVLSRCIGLPGDTIHVFNDRFIIDGKEYTPSPDMIETYSFSPLYIDTVKILMKAMNIPLREANVQNDTIFPLYLSRFELYLVDQKLDYPDDLFMLQGDSLSYSFVIPHKGMSIKLNPENRVLYEQAVNFETGGMADKETENKEYVFTDNYYWMLSDNTVNSIDSRTIGFIPHKSVIGKASLIWCSSGANGFRWNRCFSDVN
jgi:signal peptidase I